jgi:hypothetical protein
MNLGTVQNDR